MKTRFTSAGISHLVSVHDVDASSAFFCLDKTWTDPSQMQQARFLQLGLSHMWQHGAVAGCYQHLPVPTMAGQGTQTTPLALAQGSSPQPTARSPSAVTHMRGAVAGEALALGVCTGVGFTPK